MQLVLGNHMDLKALEVQSCLSWEAAALLPGLLLPPLPPPIYNTLSFRRRVVELLCIGIIGIKSYLLI